MRLCPCLPPHRKVAYNVFLYCPGLEAAFPDGKYRQLPDEVYKRLEFHPASFEVKEHHVAVYAGTDNETIVKARRQMEVKPLVDAYFAWAKIPARISE